MLASEQSTEQFKMRISPQDRVMLKSLARYLQRSQADTVKMLLRGAFEMIAEKNDEESKPNQEQAAAL